MNNLATQAGGNKSVKTLANVLGSIRSTDRVVVLIDGANVFYTARNLNFDIDYKKLKSILSERCQLIRMNYYTPVREVVSDDSKSNSEFGGSAFVPMQALIDWLEYNGYTVIQKKVIEHTDTTRTSRASRADLDIEIAVGFFMAMEYADHIVLFSGDGDFVPLLELGKARGKKVTVVSSARSKPVIVSDTLRRTADNFIELCDLAPHIERKRVENTDKTNPRLDSDSDVYEDETDLPAFLTKPAAVADDKEKAVA